VGDPGEDRQADTATAMTAYDVFLSYNWRDHGATESIAQALRHRGLKVFLDRWYLAPGQRWQAKLEEVLGSCRAVAICIGPGDMGPWQQREKELAVDRQTRETTFPVIPVLLPGCDPVLGFLAQNTWVDLRGGLSDEVRLRVLAKAVRGEPPGAELQEALGDLRLQRVLSLVADQQPRANDRDNEAVLDECQQSVPIRLMHLRSPLAVESAREPRGINLSRRRRLPRAAAAEVESAVFINWGTGCKRSLDRTLFSRLGPRSLRRKQCGINRILLQE
jgi:hypothetical protein